MMADALGEPVIASAEAEASARGAALLALEALGVLRPLEEAPAALGRPFLPRPDRREIYTRAIERQKKLYDVLLLGQHHFQPVSW